MTSLAKLFCIKSIKISIIRNAQMQWILQWPTFSSSSSMLSFCPWRTAIFWLNWSFISSNFSRWFSGSDSSPLCSICRIFFCVKIRKNKQILQIYPYKNVASATAYKSIHWYIQDIHQFWGVFLKDFEGFNFFGLLI